jgi:ornithine--oxo-acid transaminase
MIAVEQHPRSATAAQAVQRERTYAAPIYDPLDIVVESASGAWLTDVDGRRYLDCLSAYSAVNQGHRHPRIVEAMHAQAELVSITARAVRNTVLPRFLERLCTYAEYDMAIPMNTGAEAVEAAIKVARRWGYRRKGIPDGRAEIIVCDGNFHGRTTTIVGFSPVAQYREGFGPFGPGFRSVPFGDLSALQQALSPNTCAFLVEPIQGEGGIIVPPTGYLAAAHALCREHNVLFVADEIQTGLGRTGARFATDVEHAKPDVLVLGKALSGGMYPISAVLASAEIMSALEPGDHGSTFGGNPLAAAIGIAALDVVDEERLAERAAAAGARLLAGLRRIASPIVADVRGRGLLIGVEFTIPARRVAEALLRHGVAAKDTHERVLRVTPPLVITDDEIDYLLAALTNAVNEVQAG